MTVGNHDNFEEKVHIYQNVGPQIFLIQKEL
jgi:hypothetical protein